MAGQMDALGKAIRARDEAMQKLAGGLAANLKSVRAAIIASRQAPQPEPRSYPAPWPGF